MNTPERIMLSRREHDLLVIAADFVALEIHPAQASRRYRNQMQDLAKKVGIPLSGSADERLLALGQFAHARLYHTEMIFAMVEPGDAAWPTPKYVPLRAEIAS